MKSKLCILFFIITSPFIFADEILLTSGEIIYGEIISMDENIVTVKTEYGRLEIDRVFIQKGLFYSKSLIPANGLLFEFLFNGSLSDSSPNELSLENYNNTDFSTGADNSPNNSVSSDGTGKYLLLPSCAEANSVDAFSISFWININSGSKNQYMISKWTTSEGNTADGKFAISYNNSTIYFYIVDTNGYYHLLTADNTFPTNTWTHLTFVCSPGYMAIYINSVKATENNFNFTGLKYDESPIYILTAKSNTSAPWSYYNIVGSMDNLRMYNYALNEQEIVSLWEEFSSLEE
jgi:hypothetical protein